MKNILHAERSSHIFKNFLNKTAQLLSFTHSLTPRHTYNELINKPTRNTGNALDVEKLLITIKKLEQKIHEIDEVRKLNKQIKDHDSKLGWLEKIRRDKKQMYL